jgi:hypothetical protein
MRPAGLERNHRLGLAIEAMAEGGAVEDLARFSLTGVEGSQEDDPDPVHYTSRPAMTAGSA